MTREMMPLQDAISRLADMHEAERDRLKAWADEVAPQIAVELGIPLDRLRPVLDVHLAHHLAVMAEMTHQDATVLAASVPRKLDNKLINRIRRG